MRDIYMYVKKIDIVSAFPHFYIFVAISRVKAIHLYHLLTCFVSYQDDTDPSSSHSLSFITFKHHSNSIQVVPLTWLMRAARSDGLRSS